MMNNRLLDDIERRWQTRNATTMYACLEDWLDEAEKAAHEGMEDVPRLVAEIRRLRKLVGEDADDER